MRRKLQTIPAGLVLLVGLLSLGTVPAQAEKKLLTIKLDGEVLEAPSDSAALFSMLFSSTESKTLREYTKMIRAAATDKSISGIALIIGEPEVNLAQVEELTDALQAFKAKGKPVYCYMDEGNNATYPLAAAATHITLAENSELDIIGLHGEMMFFKGLLDKIGVEAQMLHMGAYKSALEPFTRTEPSAEAAENLNWLLDSLYQRWIQLMADGRKISVDDMKKIVDEAPINSADAQKRKLVDEVASFGAYKRMLHKEFGKDARFVKDIGADEGPELKTDDIWGLLGQVRKLFEEGVSEAKGGAPAVGLIYIAGAITLGRSEPGSSTEAGSTTLRHAFEKAREDDSIKAVVVRIDSPGGSALASDIIWNAATRCADEKPVIVSMGRVAGSGGYYVAVPAATIFADASTLTASIGVVGGKFVLRDLLQGKLGITTADFTRGKHADLMSMTRKWNDAERGVIEKYMNEVYDQFKGRVTKSRGQRIKKNLDDIAGGRVYTGAQALDLGLVDKLGTLDDALNFAAEKAGLGKDYEVRPIPKPSGFAAFVQMLRKMSGGEENDEYELAAPRSAAHLGARLSATPDRMLTSLLGRQLEGRLTSDPLMQAVLPLARELAPTQLGQLFRGLHDLLLLQRERVACFMPFVEVK